MPNARIGNHKLMGWQEYDLAENHPLRVICREVDERERGMGRERMWEHAWHKSPL